MAKCILNIQSVGEGWTDNRLCHGECNFANGIFSVDYLLDGDKCHIEYSNGKFTQTRKGENNFHMEFVQGKSTQFCLKLLGNTGYSSIFTNKLDAKIQPDNTVFDISYVTGGESICVRITVKVKE